MAVHSILEHMNSIKSSTPPHILWLAHTEELCEQAYTCFKNTALHIHRNYDLRLFRYWGSYASDDIGSTTDFPYIFISTPQKIRNILEFIPYDQNEKPSQIVEIQNFFRKGLFLLIIDEAHRAGSPTYLKIIENLSEQNDFLNISGLTATPFRKEYLQDNPNSGTESLRKIFGQLILPRKNIRK